MFSFVDGDVCSARANAPSTKMRIVGCKEGYFHKFRTALLNLKVRVSRPDGSLRSRKSKMSVPGVQSYGKSELCKNHEFSNKLIQLMKRRTTRDKSRKKSNETCLLFIDVAKNDLLALKFGTNVVVVMIYLSSPRTKQTTRN